MRILYGVAGEGMGHSTRSKVVIDHLRSRGHTVMVAVSNRAYDFLSRVLPNVVRITGLRIHYVDGAMDVPGSVALNLGLMPALLARNAPVFAAADRFAPDVVITDLEPFASFYAMARGVPLRSVDNHQIIPRCDHGSLFADTPRALATVSSFVASMAPPRVPAVITSFFCPSVRPAVAARTTIVPPVLRPVILAQTPRDGDHVLAYQTSKTDTRVLDVLRAQRDTRFIVYGLGRSEALGNCTLKPFSEDGFAADLASARAVVTNGGYSLMSESVALGKPVYAVPVRDQFEQLMNARYLAALGFGATSTCFDPATLARFLRDRDQYAATLRVAPRHDANRALYAAVDGLLARRGAW